MRPLRTKEEDDDPSTVPAAVYIHESDEEGPDSGFDLTAEVVDSPAGEEAEGHHTAALHASKEEEHE